MGQGREYASFSEKKGLKSFLGLMAQTPSPLAEALGAVSSSSPLHHDCTPLGTGGSSDNLNPNRLTVDYFFLNI